MQTCQSAYGLCKGANLKRGSDGAETGRGVALPRPPAVECKARLCPYLDISDAVPVLIVSLHFLVPFISILGNPYSVLRAVPARYKLAGCGTTVMIGA